MVSSKDPNKQKITQLCKNVEFILPKFPRFKTGYRCFRSFCYCRELLRHTGLKGLDWKDWTERTGLKGLDWNFNRRIHSQHDEQLRSNLAEFSKQRNTFKSCSQRINVRLVWHSKPRARLDVKIIYISRNW